VGSYVLATARSCPVDRVGNYVELSANATDPAAVVRSPCDSLVREVEDLFSAVGVTPSAAEWQEISAAVDIGTDWLDGFAAHTGLCGEESLRPETPRTCRLRYGCANTSRVRPADR
jgi:hypothetical protein